MSSKERQRGGENERETPEYWSQVENGTYANGTTTKGMEAEAGSGGTERREKRGRV